jgi:hypothetical protein
MKTKERRNGHSILTTTLLSVLFLVLLGMVDKAQAQWSTDGNGNTTITSGKVGVSTSAPANPLTIARSGSTPYGSRPASELLQLIDRTDNTPQILFGSAYNGMLLRYTGTGNTAANQRLGVVTGGGGESFVINNDGNVGIGTNQPSTRLHIVGDNSTSYPVIKLENTQMNGHSWWLYAGASTQPGAFGLYDDTVSAYRMFFDANGNTGFGATGFDSWHSSFKVLGLNTNNGFTIAAGSTSGNGFHITDRTYFNGTN